MVPYRLALALAFSPTADCSIHLDIQIHFQAGNLQMKSRSLKFPQIPTIHQ